MGNMVALICIYAFMVMFDLAVLAGTCYLIVAHGWSAAWIIVAIIMCLRLLLVWATADVLGE